MCLIQLFAVALDWNTFFTSRYRSFRWSLCIGCKKLCSNSRGCRCYLGQGLGVLVVLFIMIL